jgi:hypothetical protein
MKRAVLGCLLLSALAAPAGAQVRDAIEVTRQSIQTQRQAIVAAAMGLSESQGATFWPLYREYRQDMAKTGDKMLGLLENYGSKYDTMNDEDATKLMNDFMSLQKEELDVKTRWMKKMKKVLPGRDLARFFQVENKLDTIVRYDVAQSIPLVKGAETSGQAVK